MGICCSKIDNLKEVSSFNGAHHPSLEQWQAARSSCQFCQANGATADHLLCCTCETCQRAASYGVKGLVNGRSYHEAMCNLCAADVYDAHIHHQAPYVSSRSSGVLDEDDSAAHYDLMHRELTLAHSRAPSIKHSLMQGSLVNANTQLEMLKESRTFDHTFLGVDGIRTLVNGNGTLCEYEDGLYSSGTLTVCTKGDQGPLGSHEAACEIMGNSRRLSNIDDSDGIKLEVRYKHMLPHEVHIPASPHHANGLKRARPQEEQLLTEDDPEANRSIRRRKSFQIPSLDEDDLSLCSLDELDNDDNFHDISVGVSVGSFDSGKDQHPDIELCHTLDTFSHFHGNVSLQAQDVVSLECIPDYVGFTRSDLIEFDDQPLYVMSQENLQFITRKEREWEERAHGMGMEEDKICSKMQALSVVSTGDAILFSGADSDELHLFPSVAVQHQRSPLSSPKHKLGPVSPERCDEQVAMAVEKSPFSIEGIINLLENDELSEDDLFSLLIDSCTKSSETSSPTSSTESTNSWSSLLSSSSSSSSSSASSMPSLSPLSSTSVLQLPPSSTTYSLTLPYSLSLPPSCKMSPHTSFEFKVKSCGSTPSTPVFSPIRSRSKRNITHMKPSALTAEEIAEIWGVFEQRQAFISQQCMRK